MSPTNLESAPSFAMRGVEASPLQLRQDIARTAQAAPPRREATGTASGSEKELRVEWVASARDIPRAVWDECFAAPLEGYWFYDALERSGLEEQFSFAYAIVLRGEAIIALAPVFTAVLPISLVAPDFVDRIIRLGGRFLQHLRFQKTLFVGAPCSDEGSVGTLPGVTLADVAPALHKALWARARAIGAVNLVWKDFAEGDWPALRALSREAGLCEVVSYPGTRITEMSGGLDGYLQRLTGRRRHNLRKKLRLSKAEFDLTVEVVSKADAALVDEVWHLFQNTFERATTKFERLTRKFWELACENAPARLIVLRERKTGKAVAFMLVLLLGKRAINKFIGIDYEFGEKSFLYFRLWEEFVKLVAELGMHEVQSGQTGYRAKLDLGHQLVPLSNFFRYRNPIIHRIAALVSSRITWMSLDEDLAEMVRSRAWQLANDGAAER
jgi:hypothetical protein